MLYGLIYKMMVTLTGFKEGKKEQTYLQYLRELGCTCVHKLQDGIHLLVVNHTATEKYKLVCLSKKQVNCVTPAWLQDSHQKNKLLPYHNYSIPSIFFGVCVAVLDFTPDKADRIKSIVQENGGRVHVFESLSQVNDSPLPLDVLVTTKNQFNRLERTSGRRKLPIVDISWIEQSLSAKRCKFPQDYAMNYQDINTKPIKNYENKLSHKLAEALSQQTAYTYLQDTVIMIVEDAIDAKMVILFKNMIMACGGMYLQVMNPCLTHILTGPLTEQEYLSLKKYGSLAHILRIQWLLDSIILNHKLNENDYRVRCFKTNTPLLYRDTIMGPPPSLRDSKSSISLSAKGASTDIRKEVKSRIFNNCYFLVEKSTKKEYGDVIKKIRENNGVVYDMPLKAHEKYYFPVMDGPQWMRALEEYKKRNAQIIPVSIRWVNESIRKNMLIDVKEKSNIYHPFKFRTPWMQFHKYKIEVVGADEVERVRIKEVLGVLGSVRMKLNMADLTHCLCTGKYWESKKIKEIRNENQNVLFVQLQWLQECVSHGHCLPFDQYILNIQDDQAVLNNKQ